MSSHPQTEPARGHETRDANIKTILVVAGILIVCAVVIHLGIWGLFEFFKQRENAAKTTTNWLVLSQMNQLPAQPRLEGFEPVHARVVLETPEGQEQTFYVDAPVTVYRPVEGGRRSEPLDLYDLLPGTEVSLTFRDPPNGRRQVVRIEAGGTRGGPERATETGLKIITGKIKRIQPESGSDFRAAAEAELRRYGWVNREKDVAHIPIERAMQILVDQHLLSSKPEKEEGKR